MPVMHPVGDLTAYDNLDPYGDEGWNVDRLLADVRDHGIHTPLEIAYSAAHLAHGDETIFVFNGIHRLTVARLLGVRVVPVVPATRSEDAILVESLFGG